MGTPTIDDAEEAAEEAVQKIMEHEFSGSDVPQSVSKAFWESIISGLQTSLDALEEDEG